jgi:hypothetical protein
VYFLHSKKNEVTIFFLFSRKGLNTQQRKMVDAKVLLMVGAVVSVGLVVSSILGLVNSYKISGSTSGSPADKSTIPTLGTVEAAKVIDGFTLGGSVIVLVVLVYLLVQRRSGSY